MKLAHKSKKQMLPGYAGRY